MSNESNKRVYALRHVAFEHLGSLQSPLEKTGCGIELYDAPLADLRGLRFTERDFLVILGGPIGAYDEDKYPFVLDELRLIEQALANRARVLGICLGAQLIARALGARVYPGSQKEIGFSPVALTEAGRRSPLAAIGDHPVLHWHGDTFDLPAGALRLASTDLYENQAFSVGHDILGLQFHVEAQPNEIESWLVGHAAELAAEKVDLTAIRQAAAIASTILPSVCDACISEWLLASDRD